MPPDAQPPAPLRYVAAFGGPIIGTARTAEEALARFLSPAYIVEVLCPREASLYPVWKDVESLPLAGLFVVAGRIKGDA